MLIYAYDKPKELKSLQKTLQILVGEDLEFYGFSDIDKMYAAVKECKADIVFADVNYQHYAGKRLFTNIRKLYTHANLIALTDNATNSEALSMFEIRASDYLEKPLDIEKLKNAFEILHYSL